MVLLQYIVPALAIVLALLLRALGPEAAAAPTAQQAIWSVVFLLTVFGLGFDRSKGRWISFLMFVALYLLTASLYLDFADRFLAWCGCGFIAMTTIVILSQYDFSKPIRAILIILATSIILLPSALFMAIYSPDEAAYIVPATCITLALLPVFFQYAHSFRPGISWRILNLQQLALRLTIVMWAYQWKPTLLDTDISGIYRETFLVLIGILILTTNIRAEKVSWPAISLSAYSLLIIFASLFRLDRTLVLVLVGAASLGTLFVTQSSRQDEKESDLSALEVGGFGSGVFFLSLWVLYELKAKLETYELVVWFLFIVVVAAKVWSQSDREGLLGRAENEISKKIFLWKTCATTGRDLVFCWIDFESKTETLIAGVIHE